ncbi:MAG TPA: AAA family ATPase, partial [Polyangia bacterium]|nr:AAA family ATPase [Polyangia bacterium]
MEQHGRHWTGARGSWEMAGVAVSSRRPFVGRDREIDELRSGVDEAAGGRGGLFLIVGAAGMGKTRLADEAARVAEGRGARVLWGRCWETGGAPAYWPWLQILRELTRGAEGAALREALGGEAGPLAQLVPEAAAPPAARDAPPGGAAGAVDPATDRFRLFQAVVAALRACSERTPLVLIFDDLHTADPSSLKLLHFVARNLRGVRVAVIGAYRDEEARLSDSVGPLLVDIAREGTYLPLGALAAPEVRALVTAAAGEPAPEPLVAAALRASEGNPLFLSELLRLLVQRGDLARRSDEDPPALPIPDTVRELIGRRLARLSPATRDVLALASVAGRDFAAPDVSAIAGLPAPAVEERLADADRGGVILATGGAGWRFSHVLVREALYRDIPLERRAALHLAFAEHLARGAGRAPAVAEIAHHRL